MLAFWSRTRGTPDGCWRWTGARTSRGYGALKVDGRVQLAHRTAYALTRGEAPAGLLITHRCGNRRCVRPDHLRVGDATTNADDARRHGTLPRGTEVASSKLAPHQVRAIRTGRPHLSTL
jgi:hypothetical protein